MTLFAQASLIRARYRSVLLLAIGLAGCAAPAPPTVPPTEPPEVIDEARLAALVQRGDAAQRAGHFDHPYPDSALDFYRQALQLEPGWLEARRGVEAIAEQYLSAARRAAERGAHAGARSQLARARLVDAAHPGVGPTTAYLKLLRESQRSELEVKTQALRSRSSDLVARLTNFGSRSRNPACRTQIRAPDDASGRWIYQQLARAPGQERIRAQFELGSPSRVAVLCPKEESS